MFICEGRKKMKTIISKDTIWRFHVDPVDMDLYLECKNDKNEFYLWEPNANKQWHFPRLEQYVCTIVNLQFPYVLLSYYHEQNLMNQSILMSYNLTSDKEVWSSSELKIEESFLGELKVYPSKISPKRYEYINFEREKIDEPKLIEIALDVAHAEKETDKHILQYNDTKIELSIAEPAVLTINRKGKDLEKYVFDIDGIRMEYDYLIRIGGKVILLLDSRQIMLFES